MTPETPCFKFEMTRPVPFHASIINPQISVQHEWIKEEDKPSYQLKALFSRAYSIQKRQMFTNVFCIGMCPFLIVFISSILGSLANQQFNHIVHSGNLKISSLEKIISCSKLPVLDEYGWPLSAKRDLLFTSSNERVVGHFNMFKIEDNFHFLSFSQDTFEYCEFWLSNNSAWDS